MHNGISSGVWEVVRYSHRIENVTDRERAKEVYPIPREGIPAPGWNPIQRCTWRQFVLDHLTDLSLFLMAALLLGVILFPFMVVNVPSGNVGLLWLRFRSGTVLDPRLLKNEGLRIKSPWNEVFLYDLRLQSTTDTYNAIARDGVSLTATINT